MAELLNPEWKFYARPQSAIPRRKIDAFVIADLMADQIEGVPSDWQGVLVRGASFGQWQDWAKLSPSLTLNRVGFARFLPTGQIAFAAKPGERGGQGFFAIPQIRSLNAQGDDMGALGTTSVGGATNLRWISEQGTHRITAPQQEGGAQGIFNVSEPGNPDIVRLKEPWSQGRAVHADISFFGSGIVGYPDYKLKVSDVLRLSGRQGLPWALERLNPQTNDWELWRTHEQGPVFDPRGTRYEIGLYLQGGRLCWQINDSAIWLLDSAGNSSDPQSQGKLTRNGQPYTTDLSKYLGGSPLQVEASNLRARTEIMERAFPVPATVSRTLERQSNSSMRALSLTPRGIGHLPPGTSLPAEVNADAETVTYTVTLTPDEDGYHSPLLSQMLLVYEPVWTSPIVEGIDLTPAVSRATVNLAHPPIQAGAEGEFTFDIAVADSLVPKAGGGTQKLIPNWEMVTEECCPVEISGWWAYDDGVRESGHNPIQRTPEQGLLKGYILGHSGDEQGYNSGQLTFSTRDSICRLQEPAAYIDNETCWPLYYEFQKKLNAATAAAQAEGETQFVKVRAEDGTILNVRPLTPRERSYYDGEAIQAILRMFLGPAEANALNGNGNPFRFLTGDHPPLLSLSDVAGSWLAVSEAYGHQLSSGNLQDQEGISLGPPYRSYGLNWIQNFCSDFSTMFAYLLVDRENDLWPSPVYGLRELITANALLFEISGSDAEKILLSAAQTETRPENDFNRVVALGNPFGMTRPPFANAAVQGVARLRAAHPRAQERTWARTKEIESALIASPALASVFAGSVLMGLDGNELQFPSYTLPRGDGRIQPADRLVATNSGQLGLDGLTFEVLRVRHEFTKPGEGVTEWVTTCDLFVP